jgi:hypothetical protein
MTTEWQSYEQVAVYLLNQFAETFGLDGVEGKQHVNGKRSGVDWEIDGKGYRIGSDAFVIVECKRYTTSRVNQETVGGLAYRIIDTDAEGAILVTPLGSQSGGLDVGKAEQVAQVRLNADATGREYVLQFLNDIFAGVETRIGFKVVATCEVDRGKNKRD